MRLHRFYLKNKISLGEISVSDKELIHQWKSVFRLGVGDKIIIFDGHGDDFVATIKVLKKDEAVLHIDESNKGIVQDRKISLFISIPKKDKLEWVVEKTTELGVSDIYPIISERSEKKGFKKERLQKLIVEAAEQSGWSKIPTLHEVLDLEEILHREKIPLFVCDMDGKNIKDGDLKKIKEAGILIGPEGGWGSKDRNLFETKKLPKISFGDQTLRSETAAIAGSALFLSL